MIAFARTARSLLMAALAVACLSAPASAEPDRAQIEAIIKDYLLAHPDEVGEIFKRQLIANPLILQQALDEILKKYKTASTQTAKPDKGALISSNADLLFRSKHDTSLGKSDGDVTLVEFFDYNCGYCKRALSDTLALLDQDRNLRIVLKELPILGPGSAEAARIGVALRMQDQTGEKYLAFHRALLSGRGGANRETALAAAQSAGADMERLAVDVESTEVDASIAESRNLAKTLGVNGTPGYVVGNNLIPGAIGIAGLKEKIADARK